MQEWQFPTPCRSIRRRISHAINRSTRIHICVLNPGYFGRHGQGFWPLLRGNSQCCIPRQNPSPARHFASFPACHTKPSARHGSELTYDRSAMLCLPHVPTQDQRLHAQCARSHHRMDGLLQTTSAQPRPSGPGRASPSRTTRGNGTFADPVGLTLELGSKPAHGHSARRRPAWDHLHYPAKHPP